MITFVLWCILFVLCWPLALLALVLYPIVWLILLPFRIVGIAVAEQRPILVNDVHDDARYRGLVAGVTAMLAVPLRHKNRVIGALNLLSDRAGAFTPADEDILAQFAVHIAQAIANARLFEQEREHTATLETLTEIAREVAAILDLDELLSRIAILTRRVVDYRTFGIFLVNDATNQLEPKVALQYGERMKLLTIDVGNTEAVGSATPD